MLAIACARSSSLTPRTWPSRAIALRTCEASVSGSLRSVGNANALSGRSVRESFACGGFHVICMHGLYAGILTASLPRCDGFVTPTYPYGEIASATGPEIFVLAPEI